MADTEDIQPLVCDNGTGMVKVLIQDLFIGLIIFILIAVSACFAIDSRIYIVIVLTDLKIFRLDLREMMLQELCFLVL